MIVFSWNQFYCQAWVLFFVSFSVLILWISSFASEVAKHSSIQNYQDCHSTKFDKYCVLKENRLARASSLLTPLVIEFCIMSLFALAELWQEMARRDTKNQDKRDNTEDRHVPTTSALASHVPHSQAIQPGSNIREDRHSSALEVLLKDSGGRRVFPCLVFFSFWAILVTVSLFTELNNISEAAYFITGEPTESSVNELPYHHLYSEELSANVSNKVKCESDEKILKKCDNESTINSSVDSNILDECNMHNKLETYYKTTISINLACAAVFGVLLWKLCRGNLVKDPDHSFSVSDFIIITTCSAVIGYLALCSAGGIYCLLDRSVCGCLLQEYYVLQLVDNATDLLQFILQGVTLLLVERYRFHRYVRDKDEECCKIPCKVLPGLFLFLFAVNSLRWGADSFYEMKSENDAGFFQTQYTLYGKSKWHLFTQASYPLAVFFRFHSAAVFLKAFYHTWLD
ncbi:uncharacterized protein LOC134190604 [Corticium candelabrum]|uniref:uncharacterized protein LOC134190604 n=1 Tax=Corticium candelabrum TaxID=121492 RepID=UPI002E276B72|nr:uncharacterized protein LOC134190604 [Corticium candelabrum]